VNTRGYFVCGLEGFEFELVLFNIMPDKAPVKKVAIGFISWKNFSSFGADCPSGCVTNIREYKTVNIVPVNVSDRQTPTTNFNIVSISSGLCLFIELKMAVSLS
jgi:hypothetical protein